MRQNFILYEFFLSAFTIWLEFRVCQAGEIVENISVQIFGNHVYMYGSILASVGNRIMLTFGCGFMEVSLGSKIGYYILLRKFDWQISNF